MRVFIVLAAFAVAVACVSAGHPAYGPVHGGPISTGQSSQFRQEDNYGNYQFGYDESHASGGSSRREEQTNGVRRGSYSLSDADGRQRTVNYVADAHGFRASVHTNEPGVEPKDPADVLINKEGQAYGAPAPVGPIAGPAYGPAPVAPIAGPAPLPAPIAVAAPLATKGFHARGPVAFAPEPLPLPVAGPVPVAGPAYGAAVPAYGPAGPVYEEAPTPRAFSYSFGSSHLAPVAVAAPAYHAPAPIAAPAPIYQERLRY